MSTFGGKFEEIPGISVDKFDKNNLDSHAYFISHCHTDHMEGIDSKPFEEKLLTGDNTFLYASPVSVAILKLLHPQLTAKLKPLDLHQPSVVKVDETYVTVTLIPAGHCPGSVMFLFESNKTVLYTGDFRISSSDIKKFRHFYDSVGEIKPVDTVYLDTSFFDESHRFFPTRRESLNEICNLIEKWLCNDRNIIEIKTSARYGSEYLFVEIANKFKMPVHVNESAYLFYKCIPEMDGTITLDGTTTKIHSSCGTTHLEICHGKSQHVRSIKPSVLIWSGEDLTRGIVRRKHDGVYSVCYSCHASYEECLALIDFLKPKKIQPCVLPKNRNERSKMYGLIDKIIADYSNTEKSPDENFFSGIEQNVCVVETPEKKRKCDDGDDILSSPPRCRKRFQF